MTRHFRAAALFVCAFAVGVITSASANADTWMDSDWNRRIEFSADPDSIEGVGNFNNFTLLLKLDATSFAPVFATADSSGGDLVITKADGVTVLDHEIVSYDPMLQIAELWFKATSFSDAENTFYLYYDNNVETPEEAELRASLPGDAWTPEHLAVYHFAEDPSQGTLADWGPGANDAVAAVAPFPVGPGWDISNLVDGAVGKGWEYDGVDLYSYSTNLTSADSSFTISTWFANSALIDKGAVAYQGPWDQLLELDFQRTGGDPHSQTSASGGFFSWQPAILDDGMHHYTWTMDAESDTVRFFFDGIERSYFIRFTGNPGDTGSVYTSGSIHDRIGIAGPVFWNEGDLVDGIVDEFHIVEGVLSPEWVRTQYRNQQDPTTFFTATDEQLPRPTGIDSSSFTAAFGHMSVFPNPFRAVANIEVETNAIDVTVRVYDVKGRLVRTLRQPTSAGGGTAHFLWDGRDQAGSNVSNGIYYLRAQNGRAMASSKAILVR